MGVRLKPKPRGQICFDDACPRGKPARHNHLPGPLKRHPESITPLGFALHIGSAGFVNGSGHSRLDYLASANRQSRISRIAR